jgi:hypothetical protein
MRFLGYTVGDDSIPTPPPSPELMAEMGNFVEEVSASGHLIATGAFTPIATGTRKISLTDGEFTVTDGPFTEAKELIGGWALTEFDTWEEAIDNTKRFLSIVGSGESTIRRIFGDDDFPPGFDPAALAANDAANA